MAAEPKGGAPESSPDDFEGLLGQGDDNLLVRADTFDISSLRPGWRRVANSPRLLQTVAVGTAVIAPPPPVGPANPSTAVTPTGVSSNRRRAVLIAATVVALMVFIALPWVLLRREGHLASVTRDEGPPASVRPTHETLPTTTLPYEPRPTPRRVPRARSLAGVLHAMLRAEPPAASTPASSAPSPAVLPLPAKRDRPAIRTEPAAAMTSAGLQSPAPAPAPAPPPATPEVTNQLAAAPSLAPTPAPASTPPLIPALPAPHAAASPPAEAATDQPLVVAMLRRYAQAYEQLDVDAVAQVWPHADRRALTRAFSAIESQQVYFEKCNVRLMGQTATADCIGWMSFVPKVGKKDPRSLMRQWDFALQKGAGGWQITTASSR